MGSLLVPAIVLVVWIQLSLAKDQLTFPKTQYEGTLKENHDLTKTHVSVKASKPKGCHGKIAYHMTDTNIPFKIDVYSGMIWLTKELNYDQSSSYTFTVTAKAGECGGSTQVKMTILNVNLHRPQFQLDYGSAKADTKRTIYCNIDEETGHVKLYPDLKVIDEDNGDAGEIMKVLVRETDQPFTAEFNTSTGHVLVKSDKKYDFDAKRMSTYTFSLQAWDKGEYQRNSIPLDITCKVVPREKDTMAVNNFAPVFTEKNYIGRITEGKTSDNIIQVHAVDRDQDDVFGKICEYFIHEYKKSDGMPFRINHNGVISLDKPLDDQASNTFSFVVMARDCGGITSREGALITIIVDKNCNPEFVKMNDFGKFQGCAGVTRVTPQISLNKCAKSRVYATYKASVKMQTDHILKGCDRETYDASGVFKMCNVNKTVDLLPSRQHNHKWMAALLTDQDTEDEGMIEFDGKTSLDIPRDQVPYDSSKTFTVATWIWMKQQKKRQFIIAATDPARLDRKHFGLYTEGDRLVFIHRQQPKSGNEVCPSRFTWRPKIFDVHWHHIVITVDGCNSARLFVDSEEMSVAQIKEDWPLHNTDMEQRIVVGARWLGKEKKYGDFFQGYLAGLSVNSGETITEKAIHCVFKCKEKIKIDMPAPDGFQVQHKSHNMIEINGQGRAETFEQILRSLVYVNERRSPTVGRRPLQIHVKINKQALPMVSHDILVEAGIQPRLVTSGNDTKVTNVAELKKYGVPIARKLKVAATRCLKYLDFARVEVNPPMNTDESLVNPGPLLDMYGLRKKQLANGRGMVIHGLATIEQYQKILREIVFINLAPQAGIRHTFKFSFSDLNKRFESNVVATELKTARAGNQPQYDMQAMNRQSKDALLGAVKNDAFVAQSSGKSFATLIGIIVACSCLFVFIVIVVFIRFRSGDTRIIYADVPKEDTEPPAKEEETVLNVTMNPLEKFEETGEKDEEEDKKPEAKTDKMNLEWDDAYIA